MASNISTPALTPTPTPRPGPGPGPTTTSSPPTSKSIKIRKATVQDAEQISHLGTVVFTASFGTSGCTPEQLQRYLDESYSVDAIRGDLSDPQRTTLVSYDEDDDDDNNDNDNDDDVDDPSSSAEEKKKRADRITGFALLNRGSSSSEPAIAGAGQYTKPVELQRLYVGMESHGRGIGQALMNAAEGLAREEGWEHMWLGVWEYNFRAQKIYGKLGYERIGEHLFDVGGDPQWDWILVKKL